MIITTDDEAYILKILSVECPLIAITPRFTLIFSGRTCYSPMYGLSRSV